MRLNDLPPEGWAPIGSLDEDTYGALNLVSLPIWVLEQDLAHICWANTAALALWQVGSLDMLLGRRLDETVSIGVQQQLARLLAARAGTPAEGIVRWPIQRQGARLDLSVRMAAHRLADGSVTWLCEALHAAPADGDAVRPMQALLDTTVMITLYDSGGEPLYRNPAASASVRDGGERLDERFADGGAFARLTRLLHNQGQAALTLPVATRSGRRWHEVSARRCHDLPTGTAAILVSEVDVTRLKVNETRATYLSAHDSLTRLPNRSQAAQHFARLLVEAPATGRTGALVVIDLDHFKNVNDAHGHAVGDELLVKVAARLRLSVPRGNLVARFGGDEFLMLVTAPDVQAYIKGIHRRVQRILARPMMLRGTEVRITATLGAARFPQDGADFETVLRHADQAMYAAKGAGRDNLAWYQPAMDDALRARNTLERELRCALARGEFELHYQPRVCGATDGIVGAEALVRWRHPVRGLVPPDQFIPLAESTGLICTLGRWVFSQAARQAAAWAAAGHELRVSVNLSPREFLDPLLIDDMAATLRDSGCPPGLLQIEVTESMLMASDNRPLTTLQRIVALGLSIALDDFGTGYSNLAYLQRFPIHTLKIDKAFVAELPADRALAEFVVQLCRLLRLTAVAEGVETAAQRGWLRQRGVQQYQGHLFAPALPVAAFEALLSAHAATQVAPHGSSGR